MRSSACVAGVILWGLACAGPAPEPVPPEALGESPPEPDPLAGIVEGQPNEYGHVLAGDLWRDEKHKPGERLYTSADELVVRQGPSDDAPALGTLVLGSPVEFVVREGSWVHVRAAMGDGYLPYAQLTPMVLHQDLDGDGGLERLVVSWTPELAPRVQVLEPRLHPEDDRVVTMDLPLREVKRSKKLSASFVPSSQDDYGLLMVNHEGEQGHDGFVLSYQRAGGELGFLHEVQGNRHQLQFVTGGFTMGTREVYRPREGKFVPSLEDVEPAIFSPDLPRELFSILLASGERGPDTVARCSTLGRLATGTHKNRPLVSCTIDWPGRWDHGDSFDSRTPYRFVAESDSRWVWLQRASGDESSWRRTLLERLRTERGIAIETDPDTLVRGLSFTSKLQSGLWLKGTAKGTWDRSELEILLTDPVLGPIYGGRPEVGTMTDVLLVPQPDDLTLLYSYPYDLAEWGELTPDPRRGRAYTPFLQDCYTISEVHVRLVAAEDADLQLFATIPSGEPLYTLVDPAHPFHAQLYEEAVKRRVGPTGSLSEFLADAPYYLWRDAFGRLVAFHLEGLWPIEFCPRDAVYPY